MERFAIVSVNRDGNSATVGNANTYEEAKAEMSRSFRGCDGTPPLVYLLVERGLSWVVQGHAFPPTSAPALRFTF